MQLEQFARGDGPSWTETNGYSKEFTKEGKAIETPVEQTGLERWGLWSAFDYYGDGRNLYQGSIGIDYRIAPHWLIGADARLGYVNQNSGLGLAQGGLYTSFYEKNWWAVAGTYLGSNQYTLYGGTGYDFQQGRWLFGPLVIWQWDDWTVNDGFGKGNLWQTRVGGQLSYVGRISPWLVVAYQNQAIDEVPNRQNGVWVGAGLSYFFNDHWSIFGGYSFEGNGNYQINQGELGFRWQF